MKRLSILLLTLISVVACKKEEPSFTVSALTDAEDGLQVYLKKADANNQPITLDSTVIENGRFSFTGNQPQAEAHYIFIQGKRGNIALILENANIEVTAYQDSLQFSKISGTQHNKDYQDYVTTVRSMNGKMMDISRKLSKARSENDSTQMLLAREAMKGFQKELSDYRTNFVKERPNSYYSTILLWQLFKSKSISVKEAKELFEGLSPEMKETHHSKMLAEDLANAVSTDIGDLAPDFSAKTPEEELLALSDVKGKVTLIDFWASWCGPCRVENPKVVAMYNRLHDKGFNIIGVSLDRQKENWVKAIADDKLTWPQVSNLAFWNDPIVKKYGVQAVPHTVLLDAEGRIVAKNLRGEALESRIEELLNL